MQPRDDWSERLGWAFGLLDDARSERQRAIVRLGETQRWRSEALKGYNEVSDRPGHPAYRSRLDRYVLARRHTLPDALWDRPGPAAIPDWPGLPYAVLYLQWESRYPDEWFAHAKSWGTKKGLLDTFARAGREFPAEVRRRLVGLIVDAVCREHRCEDVGYARLARAVDGADLRIRLDAVAGGPDPAHRARAGYLLWVLEHPEASRPKTSQWLTWHAKRAESAGTVEVL
jgi:hypothetical protein